MEDCYIEVSDEVAEQIKAAERAEHAYIERIRYHKQCRTYLDTPMPKLHFKFMQMQPMS